MRRPFTRLAAACALVLATTGFTGSALAGNGNGQGNDSAPGQVKKDQPAATQAPAPATQPQQQAAQPQSGQEPPGQAKKQQAATAAPSAQSSSQQTAAQTGPGVKPNSKTTHWTHCVTGTSASGTTCTSSDNGHTPQPNADASKRYGNGKTAAQIAVSRGGIGVQLTGPGNSQPHKVTVCGKPNNKSGGVDVHAVKSYPAGGCAQTPIHAAVTAPQAPCGFVVVATNSETGTSHGHGKGLSHNKHEASTSSFSLQPDSTQSCHASSVAPVTQASAAPSTPAASPVVQSSRVTDLATPSSPATPSSTAAPAKKNAGGVLGVQVTLKSPKPARHGVLGTVTNVAGSSLPFTGFPIWLAVVMAGALILAGLMLRRRGAVNRI